MWAAAAVSCAIRLAILFLMAHGTVTSTTSTTFMHSRDLSNNKSIPSRTSINTQHACMFAVRIRLKGSFPILLSIRVAIWCWRHAICLFILVGQYSTNRILFIHSASHSFRQIGFSQNRPIIIFVHTYASRHAATI